MIQIRAARSILVCSLVSFGITISGPALGQEGAPSSAPSQMSGANPPVIESSASDIIRCKSGRDVREVSIKSLNPGKKVPCEVIYKKADSEKVIFSAQVQEGFCETKATEFSEKLSGMGFSCTR